MGNSPRANPLRAAQPGLAALSGRASCRGEWCAMGTYLVHAVFDAQLTSARGCLSGGDVVPGRCEAETTCPQKLVCLNLAHRVLRVAKGISTAVSPEREAMARVSSLIKGYPTLNVYVDLFSHHA